MRPFTFLLMLLLQRLDDTLRNEMRRSRRDQAGVVLLQHRRRKLVARLKRSFAPLQPSGY